MPSQSRPAVLGKIARHLIRTAGRAVLSTAHQSCGGWPYGSLVLAASNHDASPLLLLSDLAEHSKNIAADARVSLLYDETAGPDDPLTGLRMTVMGHCEQVSDPVARKRYVARHPPAALYVGFADFKTYRVAVAEIHMIRGFGQIDRLAGGDAVLPEVMALRDIEPAIVARLNTLDARTLARCADPAGDLPEHDWQVTGCDTEGCDLRCSGRTVRIDFDSPALDAEAAWQAFQRKIRRPGH